jgi:hypothetical protein
MDLYKYAALSPEEARAIYRVHIRRFFETLRGQPGIVLSRLQLTDWVQRELSRNPDLDALIRREVSPDAIGYVLEDILRLWEIERVSVSLARSRLASNTTGGLSV